MASDVGPTPRVVPSSTEALPQTCGPGAPTEQMGHVATMSPRALYSRALQKRAGVKMSGLAHVPPLGEAGAWRTPTWAWDRCEAPGGGWVGGVHSSQPEGQWASSHISPDPPYWPAIIPVRGWLDLNPSAGPYDPGYPVSLAGRALGSAPGLALKGGKGDSQHGGIFQNMESLLEFGGVQERPRSTHMQCPLPATAGDTPSPSPGLHFHVLLSFQGPLVSL